MVPHNGLIPGAAIKTNGGFGNNHGSDTSEDAIIVEAKDEESGSDSLKDNSNLEETEITVNTLDTKNTTTTESGHRNGQRAYPGSIMRLHEDRRLLYNSSIAPIRKDKPTVSSTSSVSSISSVSSSTISSASVSPAISSSRPVDSGKGEITTPSAVNNAQQNNNNSNGGGTQQPQPRPQSQRLNVVSLRADENEQCILS